MIEKGAYILKTVIVGAIVMGSVSQASARIRLSAPVSPGAESDPASPLSKARSIATRVLSPDATARVVENLALGESRALWEAQDWSADFEPADRSADLHAMRRILGSGFQVEILPEEEIAIAPRMNPLSKGRLAILALSLPEFTLFSGGGVFDGNRNRKAIVDSPVFGPGQAPIRTPKVALDPSGEFSQTKASSAMIPVPAPFASVIAEESRAAGVDPEALRSLIAIKSRFNPNLAAGGAYGLMLVTHGAATEAGLHGADLFDPVLNIRVGARHLGRLLRVVGGRLHRALAAYEIGLRAVLNHGGIPNDPRVKGLLEAFESEYRGATRRIEPPTVIEQGLDAIRGGPQALQSATDPWVPLLPRLHAAAARHGVDPLLIEAIVRQENPWADPYRISPKGAIGLGQLMPATAAWLGVTDPFDPDLNMEGTARYMRYLLTRDFIAGEVVLAVAAYNAGEGRVRKLGCVPNFPETRRYLERVMSIYSSLGGTPPDATPFLSACSPPIGMPRDVQ